MASRAVLAGVALALAASSAAAAQDAAQPAPAAPAAADTSAKQIETYRREVFRYQRAGRPDPFQPLLTTAELGYRVEDLRLTSIVYSPDPRLSIAVFAAADGSARFRLRRGQRLGGITVGAIYPRRVDLQVSEFGNVRTQSVTLQRAGAEMAPGPGAGAATVQNAGQGQPGGTQQVIIQQAPAAPAPPPGPLRRGGSQPAGRPQAAPAQAPAQSQPQSSSPNPRRATGQASPRYR